MTYKMEELLQNQFQQILENVQLFDEVISEGKETGFAQFKECVKKLDELAFEHMIFNEAKKKMKEPELEINLESGEIPDDIGLKKKITELMNQEEEHRGKPKDGKFTKEFDKKLKGLKKGKKATRASTLDVEAVASTSVSESLDPWTKQPIEEPFKAPQCGHMFDKNVLKVKLKEYVSHRKKEFRCPYVGCQESITIKDITQLLE